MVNIPFQVYRQEQTEATLSVLLRLASGMPASDPYSLVGGTAVYLLCRAHEDLNEHIGSMDVDLALSPTIPSRPPLSDTLKKVGLSPDKGDVHSMYWYAPVGPKQKVQVDLLTPKLTDQSPEYIEIGGIQTWCPPGSAALLESPLKLPQSGTAWGAGQMTTTVTVANGASIIMAKARSYKDRARGQNKHSIDFPKAGKNAYDLFYLVSCYADGFSALVAQWKQMAFHALKRATLEILQDEFANAGLLGPTLAAGFIRANGREMRGLEQAVSDQIMAFIDAVR